MKWLGVKWRSSILFRVISTTFLLSIVLISLVGSILFIQISNGIYREKTNESLSEAQSLYEYAQGQLDATLYLPSLKLPAVVAKILHSNDLTLATTPREVVLLGSPLAKKVNDKYNGASDNVDFNSIPDSLRVSVRGLGTAKWIRGEIGFQDGTKRSAIIVGHVIEVPPQSPYELYYVFLLTEQQTIVDFIGRLLLFAGFLLVFMIGGISWYVIRQAINPIKDAAEIAEQLTAGDLNRRMQVTGEDEMTRLAISFNEMALSMQQQISRLENLSRLQQRFVSDVSHELRTPLTTIRMASDVITESKGRMDPAAARSAELLQSQIIRFESLLTDLLEVSRFDASASILELKDVDIKSIVLQSIDQMQVGHTGQIRTYFPESEVVASVDPRRIERVLRNLISNAIDHSEGQAIDITIKDTDIEVAVGVRDYGIGFTERESERLFDRFWRADPSRSRLRGGTGLGLSIALDDAKLHQGTLKAWGAPGKGANFVLTVPKAPGIPIQEEPIAANPNDESSTSFLSFDEDDI
ncbi:MAG: MtrAB system histidine kinase MtrB [Actinomycetes bacterium]